MSAEAFHRLVFTKRAPSRRVDRARSKQPPPRPSCEVSPVARPTSGVESFSRGYSCFYLPRARIFEPRIVRATSTLAHRSRHAVAASPSTHPWRVKPRFLRRTIADSNDVAARTRRRVDRDANRLGCAPRHASVTLLRPLVLEITCSPYDSEVSNSDTPRANASSGSPRGFPRRASCVHAPDDAVHRKRLPKKKEKATRARTHVRRRDRATEPRPVTRAKGSH